MIHVRLGCGEHRLLHRCPLRNLLINSMVYVSGKTSLCRWGGLGVKDGETGGEGKGGVTQFARDLIELHSDKKMRCRGLLREQQQNFGVTPRGVRHQL